jgi:alpha-ketoglutarate-dependent taurine dioxygenase
MPSVGSLLHGIEISRTGGITQFINMYKVYDDLPEPCAARSRAARAPRFRHAAPHHRAPPPTAGEQARMPPVWHPMVRRHPVSGRKSLYISSIYNDAVEGLDEAARALIEELSAFAAQPQIHVPARLGAARRADVGQPLHRPCRDAADPDERRVMHRTTIVGNEPVVAA